MGLTIHYDLGADVDAPGARALVTLLHEHALRLRCFDHVSHVSEAGAGIPADDLTASTLRRASHLHLMRQPRMGSATPPACCSVPPLHAVLFSASSNGADPVLIGLATHPERHRTVLQGRRVTVSLRKRHRYTLRSFCKTQYASLPQHGGTANFLRAHRGVVALLDHAIRIGCAVDVKDEGGYWKSRDADRLLAEVESSNIAIAQMVGAFLDSLPPELRSGVVAPILDHPDFEHLEAQGAARERRRAR